MEVFAGHFTPSDQRLPKPVGNIKRSVQSGCEFPDVLSPHGPIEGANLQHLLYFASE